MSNTNVVICVVGGCVYPCPKNLHSLKLILGCRQFWGKNDRACDSRTTHARKCWCEQFTIATLTTILEIKLLISNLQYTVFGFGFFCVTYPWYTHPKFCVVWPVTQDLNHFGLQTRSAWHHPREAPDLPLLRSDFMVLGLGCVSLR